MCVSINYLEINVYMTTSKGTRLWRRRGGVIQGQEVKKRLKEEMTVNYNTADQNK